MVSHYHTETMISVDYADDLMLLKNAPVQAESLLDSLEQAVSSISFNVNINKPVFMRFKQEKTCSLKVASLGRNISLSEKDINMRILKCDFSDTIKGDFF